MFYKIYLLQKNLVDLSVDKTDLKSVTALLNVINYISAYAIAFMKQGCNAKKIS